MSLRDELVVAMQATAGRRPRKVSIKGWGDMYVVDVLVSEVETSTEASEAMATMTGIPADKIRLARGAAQVICDESGKLVFDPNSKDDICLLASQPWNRLRKVVEDEPEGN